MSGVKGRSGGARANTGGKRPGAGRKPKAVAPTADQAISAQKPDLDPLAFLASIYADPKISPTVRVRAAIAHAQYLHAPAKAAVPPKLGKKERAEIEAQGAAKERAHMAGRFAPGQPPLRVVGSKTSPKGDS